MARLEDLGLGQARRPRCQEDLAPCLGPSMRLCGTKRRGNDGGDGGDDDDDDDDNEDDDIDNDIAVMVIMSMMTIVIYSVVYELR